MDATRLSKIERLVQKELGDMFMRLTPTFGGTLISVTEVRVTSDLSIAKVFVSIFPQNKADFVMKTLKNSVKGIRYEFGTRVRTQLRQIPDLVFYLDDSLDKLDHIDKILNETKEKFGDALERAVNEPEID